MTKDGKIFDVFLSHSHLDAIFVEELARRLEDRARLRVWLDRWVLVPGVNGGVKFPKYGGIIFPIPI